MFFGAEADEGAHITVRARRFVNSSDADWGPLGVIFDQRIVIAPDVLLRGEHPVLWIRDDGSRTLLHRMRGTEFDDGRTKPDIDLRISSDLTIRGAETGR